MTQKNYFKQKIEGVQKAIWDFQFKRYKTQTIREEIRQGYDNLKSKLSVFSAKTNTETSPEKQALEKEIEKSIQQMKVLDIEINGSGSSQEYPEGIQGVNQQLDALRELQEMLKDYIKQL
uniref:Uncharacterized protein n=1 Tax=viral metagenome TaxID=1070528 RepID=A0A6H1ZTC4_9ZZZZ